MKWLYKLEYKFGRHYIRNLMTVIVAGMVIVYLADLFFSPSGVSISSYLSLNTAAILSGQVWRLITFIFVYPNSGAFFLLISLYFYYMMGQMLENYWGGFRLNIYYLFGIVGAIVGTLLSHLLFSILLGQGVTVYGTNTYLNLSLFLAFAVIAPDMEFRLFFLIPVKAKWLMLAYAVMLVVPVLQTFLFVGVTYGLIQLVQLVFSLINFLIFFGPTLIGNIKQQRLVAKNRRQWRNRNR